MAALATTDTLAARLPFVMSADELRDAQGALDDLSDEARYLGNSTWVDAEHTPTEVCNLVLKAAARFMKNPDGYTVSRAGDESVGWSDRRTNVDEAGSAYFSSAEKERLRDLGGRQNSGFHSVGMFAFQTQPNGTSPEGFVPVEGSDYMFPMFSNDEDPW